MDICLVVVMTIYPTLQPSQVKQFKDALNVCEQVVQTAERTDNEHIELLALAVAAEETRFRHIRHKGSGAQGPMQVLPKYWCPKEGPCDYIEASFKALDHYVTSSPSERRALERYAGAGKRARDYAERVLKRLKTYRALAAALDGC